MRLADNNVEPESEIVFDNDVTSVFDNDKLTHYFTLIFYNKQDMSISSVMSIVL